MPSDTAVTEVGTLFEPAGPNCWVPTELARGPWDPGACHGGPVSALLVRTVEHARSDAAVDWQIARASIELVRPVPVGRPLTASVSVERPGRKVSLVAAHLSDGDTEVARVRCLRMRTINLDLPDDVAQPSSDPPGTPDDVSRTRVEWAAGDDIAFHKDACDHRFTGGGFATPGPADVWIKLLVGVVPDETPSGAQRAVAAADFGNGVSGGLPFERFTFINPDLTVHLLRPPRGEWIGMRSASYYGTAIDSTGAGFAESALYDGAGRIGRSVQSLFLDER